MASNLLGYRGFFGFTPRSITGVNLAMNPCSKCYARNTNLGGICVFGPEAHFYANTMELIH
jgi:hypothetical protein